MNDSRPAKQRREILIVDDTPDNLRLLSQILTERGYRVRVATSGRRALETAVLAPPGLILLDIKMPGLDGFATCEALKAARATAEIPVLFISALDDVADKVRAFAAGGLDYITKPFQPEEVIARVETHLALHELQQELARKNWRMAQELALAGEVQASFLPERLPRLPGWESSVTLLPAKETSGDFYDVFELPGGRFGILVADVVDKGVCAALFMALTYALFRTHAAEQEIEPAAVFSAVNHHILHDTHADQFVTAFYAILDPTSGSLLYSSAGHSPGLHLRSGEAVWLKNTGIPLGIFPDATWRQQAVSLAPGDDLLLYTDGVLDAEDEAGRPFGLERLAASAARIHGAPAEQIKTQIIADIQHHAGRRPLPDDLVVLILSRRNPRFPHS